MGIYARERLHRLHFKDVHAGIGHHLDHLPDMPVRINLHKGKEDICERRFITRSCERNRHRITDLEGGGKVMSGYRVDVSPLTAQKIPLNPPVGVTPTCTPVRFNSAIN